MNKIRKEDLKTHVAFVDTNILWYEDKSFVVNPGFDSFWDNYSKSFKMELLVPEVVRGELLIQQSTSAINSMEKISEQMRKISAITKRKYSHRITKDQIKQNVSKKFEKWLKSKDGKIVYTPIKSINWESLIKSAIWKIPPFVFDPNKKDNEKGFKDALILETLLDYCYHEQRDVNIVFLCNDGLLRETADKKLKDDPKFLSYLSLSDFESYLKLSQEKLTKQFIMFLLKKASLKFFTLGDEACLALRENITGFLMEKYAKYIDSPEYSEYPFEPTSINIGSLLSTWEPVSAGDTTTWLATPESWKPIDSGKFLFSNTQFDRIGDKNTYYFINQITYEREFYRGRTMSEIFGRPLIEGLKTENRILKLPFYITWKAKIISDGRFREISIENDELKDNSFEPTTK